MKVFVTGADGFIGSHLCEALRDRGDEVTGLALYNSFDSFGWLDEVDGVQKVRGDIRDGAQMAGLIKQYEIVFHLAALISVPYSYNAPQSFIDTNVTGTLNVLLAAAGAGAKFIHTSTSEVYGSAQYTPMDEAHPICPQSPYAASKVAADALVRAFHLSYGLLAVILRPFNTYGPRQSERAVVATIIRQALDTRCQKIWLGDPSAERDFMYVGDTVKAFLAATGLEDFGPFNVGTGRRNRILTLADAVRLMASPGKLIDRDPSLERPPKSEVARLCANARRFTAQTGWKPETSLDEGLMRTIDWWRTREFRKDMVYVA